MNRNDVLEARKRKYRYNAWANDRVLEALVQNAASSDGSWDSGDPHAQATLLLTHVLRAEEVWHARIHGEVGPIAQLWEPLAGEQAVAVDPLAIGLRLGSLPPLAKRAPGAGKPSLPTCRPTTWRELSRIGTVGVSNSSRI